MTMEDTTTREDEVIVEVKIIVLTTQGVLTRGGFNHPTLEEEGEERRNRTKEFKECSTCQAKEA